MDKFKWFMDKYELELSSSEKSKKTTDAGAQEGRDDLDLSGSEFISTLLSRFLALYLTKSQLRFAEIHYKSP